MIFVPRALATPLLAVLTACSPAPDAAPGDPCAGQRPGTACTWLGVKGEEGFNGDGQPRHLALLSQPQDLVFLPDGTALLADFNNHLVRRVDSDGTVTSVVGTTDPIFPGDGPLGGAPEGGAAGSQWQLFHPASLALDATGQVLIVAWHNHKLLRLDPGESWVTIFAGGDAAGFAGDGGPATAALFRQPADAAIDDAGNVYLVDQLNLRIRRIDEDGVVDTFAGTGMAGGEGDGGPALEATFAWAAGSNPNPSGGITYHAGVLYVADTEGHRIRRIDLATGLIDTVAGRGEPGYDGDGGPAVAASLRGPRDPEIGPDGDLYFADTDNGTVRAIDLDGGVIRTVAGTGELGLAEAEQRPPRETPLRRPFGIAFDPAGHLYVIDSLNDRVVKIVQWP